MSLNWPIMDQVGQLDVGVQASPFQYLVSTLHRLVPSTLWDLVDSAHYAEWFVALCQLSDGAVSRIGLACQYYLHIWDVVVLDDLFGVENDNMKMATIVILLGCGVIQFTHTHVLSCRCLSVSLSAVSHKYCMMTVVFLSCIHISYHLTLLQILFICSWPPLTIITAEYTTARFLFIFNLLQNYMWCFLITRCLHSSCGDRDA